MKKSLIVLVCCLSLLLAAQNASNWHISNEQGKISLAYKQKQLLEDISLVGYTIDYKSSRFKMDGADFKQDGDTYVWHKQTDQADATLKIVCTAKSAAIDILLIAQPEGPFELSFHLSIDNFRNEDGTLFAKLGKTPFSIEKTIPFQTHYARSITFDLPEIQHTFSNLGQGNFMLQDRRDTPQSIVRYITVYQANEPTTIHAQLEWSVNEAFEPEELRIRRKKYKLPIARPKPVVVPNAGFEDGLDQWRHDANASLDSTVAHSGKNSIKLVVKDPKTENVYITRHVPVIGGASYTADCFVKTDNIKKTPGRMPTVGAGLIVEWLNKDHEWISGGEYACNLFGSNDWTRRTCQKLRAPDEAAFAYVFLAVRGSGTAWFDDFSLTLVERSIDKFAPLPDSILETNAPFFSWISLFGVTQYTVEFSQSPDFPQDATRSYELGSKTSFQIPEVLAPGVWHWRVVAPGAPDITPWSFKQTVPLDKDCIPPVIITQAKRILEGTTPITIEVTDNSQVQPTVTATAPGTSSVKVTYIGREDDRFVFSLLPEKGWNKGFTAIKVTAEDKAGNKTQKDAWLICAPVPENAVVIDQDGYYSQNGKHIFPFGIYEVLKDDMLEVRKAGFDAVHTYRWESSQDDDACRQYLDDCWAADHLRAFIGFDRGNGSDNGIVQGNFEHVARRVGALADHPGLFCWYLFDEPEIPAQYVPPQLLTEFADLVRTLDPYHPVVMTTWGPNMNKYRRTWDTHWTQAYYKPAGVVNTLAQHRSFLKNASPITLLVHSYDKEKSNGSRSVEDGKSLDFQPDYDWMRAAAFVGIVKDVNGLWWWWFARRTPNGYYPVGKSPEGWRNLQKVIAEITALRPVLTAVAPTQSGTVTVDKANIEWWSKTVDNKTTFIAVNTSEEPVTATLPLPGGPKSLTFKRFEVKVMK